MDRQVLRLLAVENAPAIYTNNALKFGKVRTVGDKTAGQRLFDVRPLNVAAFTPVELGDPRLSTGDWWRVKEEQGQAAAERVGQG